MIRSGNIDPNNSYNEFAQQVISIDCAVGASFDNAVAGVIMPWAGKIISAKFRAFHMTDADDSVKVDILKNDVAITSAAVDPTAADTTTTFSLTSSTFAAGDIISLDVLTGAGDDLYGTLTLVVRPYLGRAERAGASLLG